MLQTDANMYRAHTSMTMVRLKKSSQQTLKMKREKIHTELQQQAGTCALGLSLSQTLNQLV